MNQIDAPAVCHLRVLHDPATDRLAGKEPREEVHCGDGHANAEENAGENAFRSPSPKANVRPATTIATSDRPRAMVLVKAV